MSFRIVADDYGMSTQTNEAISQLAEKKIVSNVSVMATRSSQYLNNNLDEKMDVGLHINLTAEADLIEIDIDISSPLRLIRNLYLGRLSVDKIVENIEYQFSRLNEKGFHLSYIDTHQHIHIIPKVLDALIIFSKKRRINTIRCITLEKKYCFYYLASIIRCGFIKQVPKIIVLYFMGMVMKKKLDKEGIGYCKNLLLMPLAIDGDYQKLLEILISRFKDSNNEAEIVSHPGLSSEGKVYDKYMSGREIEYRSLMKLGL